MTDPVLRRAGWLLAPLVLAAVQIGASFPAGGGQPDRRPLDALAVLLLAIGPLSLPLGRARPWVPVVAATGAASVFILLGYPFGPVFLSVMIALFLAGQHGPRSLVVALGVGAAVAIVTAAALDPRGDEVRPIHALLVLGWLAAVLAGSEITRSRRAQWAERRRNDQLAREQRTNAERLALARELHDVLAHNISLINVQSSVALHLLDRQPERAATALAHVKQASAEALDELRVALDLLRGQRSAAGPDDGPGPDQRPAPRSPSPRLDDLDDLLDGVRAGGLRVDRHDGDLPADLPETAELAAFRIVQEALTNVTRHAGADRAEIRLGAIDGHLVVSVADDGHGPLGGRTIEGRGLLGMRERAAALGGTLRAGPDAGGGFVVVARLPLSPEQSSLTGKRADDHPAGTAGGR